MSEVNHRRNGKKYATSHSGHGWTKRSRAASRFWKREHGISKALRRAENGNTKSMLNYGMLEFT